MPDDHSAPDWIARAEAMDIHYCPQHKRIALRLVDGRWVCSKCDGLARAMEKQKKRRKGC